MKSLANAFARPSRLAELPHARRGPLTSDLVLAPADFGLGMVPARFQPDAIAHSVCGFCSTGCELQIHLQDGQAVGATPAPSYPVNLGMACPKGWEAVAVLDAADRGTTPLVRDRCGNPTAVDWPTAMGVFCDRLKAIAAAHGPESIAFLSTGQIATEEMALLGALAKFGMGMLHGDGNTRQCMATAVVAYKQSFGFDAPPYTYQDFEESDVIFLVGSNLCIAHPILWQRVLRNRRNPRIVVVDPRMTETAMAATDHLAIRPKSDLVFFYALANLLIENGWIDPPFIAAHTAGFDEFRRHVADFTPQRAEQASGIAPSELLRVARMIRDGQRVSFWWTMGVNQSYEGVRVAQSLINLALITGNIGRPGTGANSITGQCNAMGSRLFSNTTCLLGGRDFENDEHRRQVANVLDIDPARVPDRPSWAYHEIIEGILRDKIKALWVVCTNPAHSWINQNTCHEILDRLDFLVVQDMYSSTETAQRADLFLPAAGWGEKEGTLINSERRIGRIRPVSKAPGQALSDFRIFRLVAEAWGCGEMFADWRTPEAVFHMLRRLSRGTPCDFYGVDDYAALDARCGIQWPYPGERADSAPQRRLFADGRFYHADGRARLLFEEPREMPEPPTEKFPYLLLTGRASAAQWHTQTRTAKSAALRRLGSEKPIVQINPADATTENIRPGGRVIVQSQRGQMLAWAWVTPCVQRGQVFVPMHYPETNKLTLAHFDPYSKQPSYKNCAVRLRALGPHELAP